MNNHRITDRPFRLRMMIMLALLPVAFIAGRVTEPNRFTIRQAEATPVPSALPIGVDTFHDASEEVTCWRIERGLSCLPDQWLASAKAPE